MYKITPRGEERGHLSKPRLTQRHLQRKGQDANVIYHTPTCPPASHMGPSSEPLVISIPGCQQILERSFEGVFSRTVSSASLPKTDEYSPNHACWSPCTSIANPKSASLTAAPFSLLANNRFSGCWGEKGEVRC